MSGLDRFIDAQATTYAAALAEIAAGDKRSHWMWFVFPQIAGLGRSPTAQFYALASLDEARAYLAHPLLGARLRDCVAAFAASPAVSAEAAFGTIDAIKLRSSLTLFAAVEAGGTFDATLGRWFGGSPDPATLALIRPTSA